MKFRLKILTCFLLALYENSSPAPPLKYHLPHKRSPHKASCHQPHICINASTHQLAFSEYIFRIYFTHYLKRRKKKHKLRHTYHYQPYRFRYFFLPRERKCSCSGPFARRGSFNSTALLSEWALGSS